MSNNYRVSIARSEREYADVIVQAPNEEAVWAYIKHLQEAGTDSEAYCAMVNHASWQSGDGSFDDEIIDVDDWEHDVPDVVVPENFTPPPEPEPEPAPTPDVQIAPDLLLLLTQVAQDATDLLQCNCTHAGHNAVTACDGTCTYGMATAALARLGGAK